MSISKREHDRGVSGLTVAEQAVDHIAVLYFIGPGKGVLH